MNKTRCFLPLALFFISLLAFGEGSYATPNITNISVNYPVIQLGYVNTIFLNCTESILNMTNTTESNMTNSTNSTEINITTISRVFADIITENATSLNKSLLQSPNGLYYMYIATRLPSVFFNITGLYNITAYCENSLNESSNATISFLVINQSMNKERGVNVSIELFDDGRIGYFDYPELITQYSRMNITVEFINTGSTTYTKRTKLEIGIYDANYSVTANRSGPITSLNPGQRSSERLRYTPMDPGYFWLRAVVSYSNKTADIWGTFYVKPYYEPWPTPGNGGGGSGGGGGGGGYGGGSGGGGGVTILEVPETTTEIIPTQKTLYGEKEMVIEYPERIYISPGEPSVVYVTVNNTGDLPLNELLLLGSINGGISMDVDPKTIQTLNGKQSATFLITLLPPAVTPFGNYSLDFTVSTYTIRKYGHIDVEVGKLGVDDSLERTIRNYQYIIMKLEEESEGLSFEGKNMTAADSYINDAKNTLKRAKDAFSTRDYEVTRDNLKKTRNHLIKAVIEIARVRGKGLFVVLAPTIWLLIALITIIIIAAVSVYVHKLDEENSTKEGLFSENSE